MSPSFQLLPREYIAHWLQLWLNLKIMFLKMTKSKCILSSSGMLRSVGWFRTDVSGLPTGPIFMGQDVPEEETLDP